MFAFSLRVLALIASLMVTVGSVVGAATAGTYTGTTSQGRPISIVVGSNGHVASWSYGYDCGSFNGTASTSIGSCPITSETFSNCGTSSCIPFVANARLAGTFTGDNLSGTLNLASQPDLISGCCTRNLTYTATREGTGGPGSCVANATTLCLNNDRFQVTARYETAGGLSGDAKVVELTPDTGYLWFFAATNVELVVKVLDACGFPTAPRFWVFAGGLTDVQVDLTVVDSHLGVTRTYRNPLGTPFAPIQDTNAFSTCP